MVLELVYTSSPKGLDPNKYGFCTVAMSDGMPPNLKRQLENLSGYRFAFKAGDPNEPNNPHVYAHWLPKIGGQVYSVLTHIRPYGVDYTKRSGNKLAHHVALEPDERVPAGPAWAMLQSEFMLTDWTGDPRLLPPTKRLPNGSNRGRVCERWKDVTGDAGWAGVLVDNFIMDAAKPAYVIYPMGTDPLPLIDEAMSLMPDAQRWRVTFSTYFTELPSGLSCAWRFCLEGTKAAKEALANPSSRSVLIDLTGSIDRAPDSRYTKLARTGNAARPAPEQPMLTDDSVGTLLAAVEPEEFEPQASGESANPTEPQYEESIAPQPARPPLSRQTVEAMPAKSGVSPLFWAVALGWPVVLLGVLAIVLPGMLRPAADQSQVNQLQARIVELEESVQASNKVASQWRDQAETLAGQLREVREENRRLAARSVMQSRPAVVPPVAGSPSEAPASNPVEQPVADVGVQTPGASRPSSVPLVDAVVLPGGRIAVELATFKVGRTGLGGLKSLTEASNQVLLDPVTLERASGIQASTFSRMTVTLPNAHAKAGSDARPFDVVRPDDRHAQIVYTGEGLSQQRVTIAAVELAEGQVNWQWKAFDRRSDERLEALAVPNGVLDWFVRSISIALQPTAGDALVWLQLIRPADHVVSLPNKSVMLRAGTGWQDCPVRAIHRAVQSDWSKANAAGVVRLAHSAIGDVQLTPTIDAKGLLVRLDATGDVDGQAMASRLQVIGPTLANAKAKFEELIEGRDIKAMIQEVDEIGKRVSRLESQAALAIKDVPKLPGNEPDFSRAPRAVKVDWDQRQRQIATARDELDIRERDLRDHKQEIGLAEVEQSIINLTREHKAVTASLEALKRLAEEQPELWVYVDKTNVVLAKVRVTADVDVVR